MTMFSSFRISGSALTAEKLRIDLVAGNLANMNTTRTPGGGPYRRRTAVFAENLARTRGVFPGSSPGPGGRFQAVPGRGVKVAAIVSDPGDPRREYDPEHPDADEGGYVHYPNVELAKEVTDLITAQRSYEANATAVNTAKDLYLKALEIGR